METKYVMTAFGRDRPGVVADVTRLLYDHGCNLEDSTMTRLEDEFAVILLFTSREPEIGELLTRECRRLERETGISAFFRKLESEKALRSGPFTLRTIRVDGVDHTGIVHRVSGYLAEENLNIENLSSKLIHSPESGTARYRMEITVQVPEGFDLEALESDLSRVGDELNVDIIVGG